ncbi:hypothetical protein [Vreelandella stevensii]|uniref:hypothetical protein n=1 Tax=Vreelandella stevensii TaxID=502821 RepID=UPI000372F2F6|nr:hypothetical protein [Halomonas stevensii]
MNAKQVKEYLYKRSSRKETLLEQVDIFTSIVERTDIDIFDNVNAYVCLIYKLAEAESDVLLEEALQHRLIFVKKALGFSVSDNIRKDVFHIYNSIQTACYNALLYLGEFEKALGIIEEMIAWNKSFDFSFAGKGYYKTSTNISKSFMVYFSLLAILKGKVEPGLIDDSILVLQKGMLKGFGSNDKVAFQEWVGTSKIVDSFTRVDRKVISSKVPNKDFKINLINNVFLRSLRLSTQGAKDKVSCKLECFC